MMSEIVKTSARAPVTVCVVGVGAMGGLVGARLMRAGADVTLVDRGERLAQLRAEGLTLIDPDGTRREHPVVRAAALGEAAGEYDAVFIAVKAYDLPQIAAGLRSLTGPETALVTLQNGIPWWYFHRHGGSLEGRTLSSLDPDGSVARHVDANRVIACIPYPAAEVLADGAVQHVEGFKLPVGELDGSVTPRVQRLAALLEAAGFKARILDDVRSETWLKAWGNLSFNPISALTGATLEELCRFAPSRQLAARMMVEAQAVGEALGASFRVPIEKRIAGAEAVGPHKTSMLQDLEQGRRLETEALIGAVLELAGITGTDTPSIYAVYAAVRLLEQTRRQHTVREDERLVATTRAARPAPGPVEPPAITR
jgi:2-dehydropantoate 2-reductase